MAISVFNVVTTGVALEWGGRVQQQPKPRFENLQRHRSANDALAGRMERIFLIEEETNFP